MNIDARFVVSRPRHLALALELSRLERDVLQPDLGIDVDLGVAAVSHRAGV